MMMLMHQSDPVQQLQHMLPLMLKGVPRGYMTSFSRYVSVIYMDMLMIPSCSFTCTALHNHNSALTAAFTIIFTQNGSNTEAAQVSAVGLMSFKYDENK